MRNWMSEPFDIVVWIQWIAFDKLASRHFRFFLRNHKNPLRGSRDWSSFDYQTRPRDWFSSEAPGKLEKLYSASVLTSWISNESQFLLFGSFFLSKISFYVWPGFGSLCAVEASAGLSRGWASYAKQIPTGWLKFNESITERHLIWSRWRHFQLGWRGTLAHCVIVEVEKKKRAFISSDDKGKGVWRRVAGKMKFLYFELSPFSSSLWLFNLPFPSRLSSSRPGENGKVSAQRRISSKTLAYAKRRPGDRERRWRRKVLTSRVKVLC